MRSTFSLVFALVLFLLTAAASAAVQLNVSVQPTGLTVGARGVVEISAADVSSLQLLRMPGRIDGLDVQQNVTYGTSMSVVNGVTNSKYIMRISFVAKKAGEFTIPAFDVVVDHNIRQPLKTKPIKINIMPIPEIEQAKVSSSEPAFALLSLPGEKAGSPNTCWVGEEIPLQLSVFARQPYELRLTAYPEITPTDAKSAIRFHDYRKVNPDAPNYESVGRHSQWIGDKSYTVYDFITKIRPLSAGPLKLRSTIDAILIDGRDFFQMSQAHRSLTAESPLITVKALPAPPSDAPYSGLIGKWESNASISPGPYRVGEPLSVKLNFYGSGQTELLSVPKFEPEHFRVYPPETKETPTGVSVNYILIPLEPGEFPLALSCSTFNSATGRYVPLKLSETVKIEKAAAGIASLPPGAAVVNAAPDLTSGTALTQPTPESILYLHDESDGGRVMLPLAVNALWFALGFLLLGATYAGGSAAICARRRVLASDPAVRRRLAARSRRASLISAIEKARPEDLPDQAGADLCLYFNDMLDLPPGTPLSETAGRVKAKDPDLGVQLEHLANTAWMPSLRSELTEEFRRRLVSAVRKFGVYAAAFAAFFVMSSASAAVPAAPVVSIPAVSAPAAPSTADEAKTAYDAGQFRQALEYYASRLDARHVSPSLLYNMGNCFYQLGDYARALVCYERAKYLLPRDSDIAGNLELTRRKLLLPPKYRVESPGDFLLAARDFLRIDEWIVLCAFGFMLVLIAAGMFFRNRAGLWRWPFYAGAAAVAVCTAALIAKAAASDPAREAVIIVRNAPLYSLPSSESGRVEQYLKQGEEVSIEENRMNWVRIRLRNNDEGWVRGAAAAPLWSDTPADVAVQPGETP